MHFSFSQLSQNPLQLKQPANNPLRFLAAETAGLKLKKNRTGLPDQLKAGAESLSGYSMDDVSVHYKLVFHKDSRSAIIGLSPAGTAIPLHLGYINDKKEYNLPQLGPIYQLLFSTNDQSFIFVKQELHTGTSRFGAPTYSPKKSNSPPPLPPQTR
ncbi:MAG: hypothetical protein INR73_06570 [Williamsia sp.]|nr:hypothetical protein [Williamsia sp.]